jgi:hypothetical protein
MKCLASFSCAFASQGQQIERNESSKKCRSKAALDEGRHLKKKKRKHRIRCYNIFELYDGNRILPSSYPKVASAYDFGHYPANYLVKKRCRMGMSNGKSIGMTLAVRYHDYCPSPKYSFYTSSLRLLYNSPGAVSLYFIVSLNSACPGQCILKDDAARVSNTHRQHCATASRHINFLPCSGAGVQSSSRVKVQARAGERGDKKRIIRTK